MRNNPVARVRSHPSGPRVRATSELASAAVLDASPNAVLAVDESGTITYANRQAEETFGYARDDLIGERVEILLPERLAERHRTHRDGFNRHPVARPTGIGLTLAGRRCDGSEFPAEISLSPVDTPNGPQVFATVVDITARKAAEDALAESERRFRTVLEASPNAIVGVAADGIIAYANPQVEANFGYTRDELIGQPIGTLLPERVRGRHRSHWARFMADPVARPMGIGLDLTGRRKDGREFPVEISLSPVETVGGVQVFATIVDITARKSAEAQLLQSQKLESIGRLAGGIAHDFNNILFAITGYTELLAQDLSPQNAALDREDALRSVHAMSEASRRGAALTAQLLAFSRQQVLSERVVEIAPAVESLQPMLQPLIGETIRLVLRTDPATGRVKVDPGQFDQILVNLVVNARDAMPNGGTVTIETGNAAFDDTYAMEHFEVTKGPYVYLSVADTGLGMDASTRERVFEPFFTTKERGKGTGLGLATIYGIVRQAGGYIWLYSEPGLGSTFKVYLPRVDEPVAEERSREPEVQPSMTGTALVVEDEAPVRDITTRLLERAGYRVIAVDDGSQALAVVESASDRIDVLVTDVVMPNMSGAELAERVSRHDPEIGIVLLSGYTADTLDLERLMARGARFVNKPVTSGELLRAIREVGATERTTQSQGAGET